MSRNLIQMVFVLLVLTACMPVGLAPEEPVMALPDATAKPEPSPTAQVPESPALPKEADWLRAPAYVESAELFMQESYPLRVVLKLRGNLPTPCHRLHTEVKPADANNRIDVEVYSLADPDKICIQALAAFELDLDLGSFSAGHYSVWVNGKKIGEFDT